MVRYKTSVEAADENAALVRAVFAALRVAAPAGLRYASYRLADGVTFVHIASHGAPNPLLALPAFKAFQARLAERCVEPPLVSELVAIDAYDS